MIGIKRTHLAAALALFLVVACTDKNRDAAAPITKERTPPLLFKSGAKISGVNGIHFGPDGLLYAASVIGSTISVVDTQAQ